MAETSEAPLANPIKELPLSTEQPCLDASRFTCLSPDGDKFTKWQALLRFQAHQGNLLTLSARDGLNERRISNSPYYTSPVLANERDPYRLSASPISPLLEHPPRFSPQHLPRFIASSQSPSNIRLATSIPTIFVSLDPDFKSPHFQVFISK